MCFLPKKMLGTVRWPESSSRASWMALPSPVVFQKIAKRQPACVFFLSVCHFPFPPETPRGHHKSPRGDRKGAGGGGMWDGVLY